MDGENLVKSLNKHGKNLQVDIQVITLADNLSHPYFSSISIAKDNYSPVGVAVLEAPYTPHISNYWIKYNDIVIISFNMMDLNQQNTNSLNFLEFNKIKQRITNDEYNYSFVCKVSRFKQEGKKFVIYFEDLGWKFMQKVPKDFRDSYIAGQYLDDAFQAICEFLGVHFAYSIEDLHQFKFGTDGYSIQRDNGKTIEDVPSILNEWGAGSTEEQDDLDDPMNENEGLIDFDKKNKNASKDNSLLKNLMFPVSEENISTLNNLASTINKEATSALNNLISPMSDKKNQEQSSDEKISKYQEEFDKKILDLFIGNTYYDSDLTSSLMNYGNITITPQSNDTSEITPEDNNMSEITSNNDDTSSNEVNNEKGNI